MKTILLATLLFLAGCTTFKTTLPNGTVILYQKGLTDTDAARAELYYEDRNILLWIVVNDPNSNIHPGRVIVPPYVIIESNK